MAFVTVATAPALPTRAQTLSLNLHEAFADTKASLGAGGVTSIVVLGDSLSYRSGTWIYEFRASMQAQYGDAGPGYQGWRTGTDTNNNWTFGYVGQDIPPHHSLDGQWASSTAGPGTPDNPTTAFQWASAPNIATHLVAGPGGGALQIGYPDGSSPVVNTLAPGDDVLVVPYQVPGAGSQLWFRPLGTGIVTILGHNSLTGLPGVVVHRVANGGWGVNNFLQRDWTFDRQLQILDPSLVMIWIGQNDQGNGRAAYAALVSSLVDRVAGAVPGSEIVLVGTYDAGGAAIPVLVGAMEDVARARALGFINLYAAGGPKQFLSENGYLDGAHFSPAGGNYFGDLVHAAFTSEEVAPFCGAAIESQPDDATADVGAQASFHVGGAATGEISYRWRRGGVALADDDRISGTGTDTLTISGLLTSDRGAYDVVLTTACGFVASRAAQLQVQVECRPDFNGDGFMDGIDYDQFVNAFEAGELRADYNLDGFVDGIDYDQFMNDFEAGC